MFVHDQQVSADAFSDSYVFKFNLIYTNYGLLQRLLATIFSTDINKCLSNFTCFFQTFMQYAK